MAAQTVEDIRAKLNSGTATDADIDELLDNDYDYSSFGPKSKAAIEDRKLSRKPKVTPEVTPEAKSEVDADDLLSDMSANEYVQSIGGKKALREAIPSNKEYKEALEQADMAPTEKDKYRIKSIQQAYYDGDIDKNTRDYMLVDTLSKFTRNFGKDLANIGAAYTGGTVNNEREDSLWDSRNKQLMKSGIGAETNEVEGTNENLGYRQGEANLAGTNLANEKTNRSLTASRALESKMNEFRNKANNSQDPNKKQAYNIAADLAALATSASTDNVGQEEYVAMALAELAESDKGGEILTNIMSLVNSGASVAGALTEVVAGVASGISDGVDAVKDMFGMGPSSEANQKALADFRAKYPSYEDNNGSSSVLRAQQLGYKGKDLEGALQYIENSPEFQKALASKASAGWWK